MKSLYIFLLLSTMLVTTSSAYARTMTLAYVNFPPYEYEKNGKAEGILVKIVEDIFKRADIPVKLVYYPFKRALQEVKVGKIDGIFNFYKNEERLKNFDYSHSIIKNPLVMFVRNDSSLSFSGNIRDLTGKRVGAMLGYSYGAAFDGAKNFQIDRANSHEANFQKLVLGRIDAYPCDRLVGMYVMQKERLSSQIKMLSKPLRVMDGHIGFTKGEHAEEISKINFVIDGMRKKDEIKHMVRRYYRALAQWLRCPECEDQFSEK